MNRMKNQLFVGILALLLFILLTANITYAKQSQNEYLEDEWNDYLNGLTRIQSNHIKAYRIYKQLISYANMRFPVVYGQTYRWGIAQPGGLIILDVSTIEKPTEILAYKFAHEWAHEALGHVPNMFNPDVNIHKPSALKNKEEDEADYYSGRFLYSYGYPIRPVVEYLKSLPLSSKNPEYSSGRIRASNVLRGFLDKRNGSHVLGLFQLRPCETELQNLKNSIYSVNGRAGYPDERASNQQTSEEILWQVAITLPLDCIANNKMQFKDEANLNAVTPYNIYGVNFRR